MDSSLIPPFRIGDTVQIVANDRTVSARVAQCDEKRLTLEIEAPASRPKPTSRRLTPRYPVELPCNVVLPSGERLTARTFDLSTSGVALLLTRAPQSGWFWVEFGRDRPLRIRAEVVTVSDTLLGYIHHCRFQFDSPATERAVASLVEACKARFVSYQRSVALRRIGPLRPNP